MNQNLPEQFLEDMGKLGIYWTLINVCAINFWLCVNLSRLIIKAIDFWLFTTIIYNVEKQMWFQNLIDEFVSSPNPTWLKINTKLIISEYQIAWAIGLPQQCFKLIWVAAEKRKSCLKQVSTFDTSLVHMRLSSVF